MSDKIMGKEKKEYGSIKNTWYLIKNIWKKDRFLFLIMLIQIPARVVIPLLGIYLPKLIIDSAVNKVGIKTLLLTVSPIILGIVVSTFIVSASKQILEGRASMYRVGYINDIGIKSIDTDFENIDGEKGQNKIIKAIMSVDNDDSPTQKIIFTGTELFSNILGFILYGGIISTLNPLILLFIVISSIINYFLGQYVNRYIHKNKDNISPIEKKLKYIREKTGDFKSAKDMRLYNMTGWFGDMYSIFLDKSLYFQKKNIYRKYLLNIADGLLIFLRDGIAYGFLVYSVLYKSMEISDFILYFGAIAGISTWLSGIVKNITDINSSSLNIDDLRDFLEIRDRSNRESGIELPKEFEMPCSIELRDVAYKYEGADDYTIKGINLFIEKGEKLALVGINGAGKTTLVKLICGLYTPSKGEIYINGNQSSLYNREEYYSLFSVVFQDTHLLPITIERNIASKNEGDIDREKMDRVIEESGFKEKIDSLPKGKETLLVKSVYEEAIELSGGEMQKLMLARALYKNSPIMILDEPTAALDPIAENEIYINYNKLTQDKTSVFISHRLSSTRFCDRIIFLDGGIISEEGNHYDLMKKDGKYSEMYDMQAHYYRDDIGGCDDES
nr:ABC transporter ATP-binding protein [Tissierella sp.]